jgi:hypothetical protein
LPLHFAKIDTKELKQRLKYTTRTETAQTTEQTICKYFLLKNTTKNIIERKTPTMNNFKTSPNQKVITIKKEKTDKQNYYAAINLNALELAAIDLKSGAFKLWIYFAKNQNNFTFALSNQAVAETFGIKKD